MPRLHMVGAAFVIAFAANHRSHQRHLIHHLGSLRQAGSNLDALGRRTDGLCAAGNFYRDEGQRFPAGSGRRPSKA